MSSAYNKNGIDTTTTTSNFTIDIYSSKNLVINTSNGGVTSVGDISAGNINASTNSITCGIVNSKTYNINYTSLPTQVNSTIGYSVTYTGNVDNTGNSNNNVNIYINNTTIGNTNNITSLFGSSSLIAGYYLLIINCINGAGQASGINVDSNTVLTLYNSPIAGSYNSSSGSTLNYVASTTVNYIGQGVNGKIIYYINTNTTYYLQQQNISKFGLNITLVRIA